MGLEDEPPLLRGSDEDCRSEAADDGDRVTEDDRPCVRWIGRRAAALRQTSERATSRKRRRITEHHGLQHRRRRLVQSITTPLHLLGSVIDHNAPGSRNHLIDRDRSGVSGADDRATPPNRCRFGWCFGGWASSDGNGGSDSADYDERGDQPIVLHSEIVGRRMPGERRLRPRLIRRRRSSRRPAVERAVRAKREQSHAAATVDAGGRRIARNHQDLPTSEATPTHMRRVGKKLTERLLHIDEDGRRVGSPLVPHHASRQG
jgi:hypothetical protein